MNNLEFRQPQTLKEALRLLSESGKNTRLIAGGTDVIPGLRQGSARFKDIRHLIDIHAPENGVDGRFIEI